MSARKVIIAQTNNGFIVEAFEAAKEDEELKRSLYVFNSYNEMRCWIANFFCCDDITDDELKELIGDNE